jgi:predicted transcriptional regulator
VVNLTIAVKFPIWEKHAAGNVDAWQVAHIKESLDEARSGAPGVLHEDVVRWVESWDTGHQSPRPNRHR